MSNEGFNPFPGFVHADNVCALQNLVTDGLEEGALAKTPELGRDPYPTAGCAYFQLSMATPAPAIDGKYVFATYNSGIPQIDGDPCPTPQNPDLHNPNGTARWLLLNIEDASNLIP